MLLWQAAEAEIEEFKTRSVSLTTEMEDSKARVSALEQEVEDSKAKVVDLENQIATLKSNVDAASEEKASALEVWPEIAIRSSFPRAWLVKCLNSKGV